MITAVVRQKVAEVADEPEYGWRGNTPLFMTDDGGHPVVRVAAVNFSPTLDIWQGLRNPAQVGRFPLTPADIWDHYAATHFSNVRPDGSPTIVAMPESFDEALGHIRRVVVICAMLVVNPEVYDTYARKMERGDQDPYDYYARLIAGNGDVSRGQPILPLAPAQGWAAPANLVLIRGHG